MVMSIGWSMMDDNNKKPKKEPVNCHKCTNAYWGCFDKCSDYKAMIHKSICKNSSVFINPDTVSMWILIANGQPIFRTEFPYVVTDKELYVLNDEAHILYNELKSIKDKFNGKEI